MTRRKFQVSAEDMSAAGLNLMREPAPPAKPSNAGSTCTRGMSARVPGLWSFLCPVIQAFRPFSCRLKGRTCAHRHWQMSHDGVLTDGNAFQSASKVAETRPSCCYVFACPVMLSLQNG